MICQSNGCTPAPSHRVPAPEPQPFGQLGQCGVKHRDLVGGGVGVGPPGTQHARQGLSSAAGAVVNEGKHRVEPEAPLAFSAAGITGRVERLQPMARA